MLDTFPHLKCFGVGLEDSQSDCSTFKAELQARLPDVSLPSCIYEECPCRGEVSFALGNDFGFKVTWIQKGFNKKKIVVVCER